VVWKLDRLSRSLRDVLTIMERLGEAGAGFRSLTEAIDTTTPAGRMMMQMVGAFAEFERAMLKERTKAGLDAAREEGRIGGRRPKLTPQQQVEIRKMVGVSGSSLQPVCGNRRGITFAGGGLGSRLQPCNLATLSCHLQNYLAYFRQHYLTCLAFLADGWGVRARSLLTVAG
jgi:hypothetical protein